MKLLVGISMAMVVALPLVAAELPRHLSGPVLVIDGDGLRIGEAEIRLFGIDAPEMRGGAAGLRSRTALEKLWVLTCGSPVQNPAELLTSSRAAQVMAALAEHADLVIYDSPPLGTVTDAAILATRTDGTLQVVRAGHARPTAILGAKSTLQMVGAQLLGPVLNRVRPADLGYASLVYSIQPTNPRGAIEKSL